MSTFFRFLYEFMSVFFGGVGKILSGLFGGIVQIFNIKEYAYVIEFYHDEFGMSQWLLVVLAVLVLIIFLVDLTMFS